MEIMFIPSIFSFSEMTALSQCPAITEWMMGVQWIMTLWGFYIPPLITMTSAVSLHPFGLELILLVGGTFSDVLSQTDHNCFFYIIVACCSTAKTWQTEQKKEKTEEETISPFTSSTHRETYTHFAFAVSPFPLVLSASPPVVESTSREHQDSALPKNLPVHPTKSICSDLWCWAVHNVSTQPGNCWTHTASCLAFWQIAVYHYFTHTHTSPSLLLKDLTMNMHATVLLKKRA